MWKNENNLVYAYYSGEQTPVSVKGKAKVKIIGKRWESVSDCVEKLKKVYK